MRGDAYAGSRKTRGRVRDRDRDRDRDKDLVRPRKGLGRDPLYWSVSCAGLSANANPAASGGLTACTQPLMRSIFHDEIRQENGIPFPLPENSP